MEVKDKKIDENENADRISQLPKDLLCHILSFLSTKEAALTSVLSKNWRYLFTERRALDFDFDVCIFVTDERSEECKRTTFMEFVNRVLALQSSSLPNINKFSLRLHRRIDENIVDDWVLQVLRREATDLSVIFLFPLKGYSLPSSIFSYGQNLTRLKIGRGKFGLILSLTKEDGIIFPKLSTLHLDSIEFGDDGAIFSLLLSKCPVLHEMIVNGMKWHHWISDASVSSPTLKRVTIDCHQDIPKREEYPPLDLGSCSPFNFGSAAPYHVSFDTPDLMYLNYSDFVACKYPIVRLDSLVEARIDIGLTIDQKQSNGVSFDATSLIMGMDRVQSLELTSDTLEVISGYCQTVPIFHYLNRLSIESDDERGWQALPLLLTNCPNLHTLIFHGLHHLMTDGCGDACACTSQYSSSSCLSSCPLKILKIWDFGATPIEMSLVELYLEKLSQLEQVIINLDFDSANEEDFDLAQVTMELKMAPRASTNLNLLIVSPDKSSGSQ